MTTFPPGDAWTDADITRLRELWDEGLTTVAIGKIIGRSKGSVISRARRSRLTPRPSPIVLRAVKVTITPDVIAPPPSPVAPRHRPAAGCLWPLWNMGPPTHQYCGQPRHGESYCWAHHRVAYHQGARYAA